MSGRISTPVLNNTTFLCLVLVVSILRTPVQSSFVLRTRSSRCVLRELRRSLLNTVGYSLWRLVTSRNLWITGTHRFSPSPNSGLRSVGISFVHKSTNMFVEVVSLGENHQLLPSFGRGLSSRVCGLFPVGRFVRKVYLRSSVGTVQLSKSVFRVFL